MTTTEQEGPSVEEKLEILRFYAEVLLGAVGTLSALYLDDQEVVVLSEKAREESLDFLAKMVSDIAKAATLLDGDNDQDSG